MPKPWATPALSGDIRVLTYDRPYDRNGARIEMVAVSPLERARWQFPFGVSNCNHAQSGDAEQS